MRVRFFSLFDEGVKFKKAIGSSGLLGGLGHS